MDGCARSEWNVESKEGFGQCSVIRREKKRRDITGKTDIAPAVYGPKCQDPRWRVNLAEEVEGTVNYMRSSKGKGHLHVRSLQIHGCICAREAKHATCYLQGRSMTRDSLI